MKKTFLKIFALLIIASMTLPMLAACENTETPTDAQIKVPVQDQQNDSGEKSTDGSENNSEKDLLTPPTNDQEQGSLNGKEESPTAGTDINGALPDGNIPDNETPTENDTEDNTEDNTENNSEDNTENNSEDNTEVNTENNSEDNTENNSEDNTEVNTEDNSEDNTEVNTEDNTEDNSEDVTEPSSPIIDDTLNLDGTTYDGQKFTIYSVEDMFEKKYFYADRTTGDGMNDSVYQRQQNVERLLNVDIVYQAAEGSGGIPAFQMYATDVQNAIKAGDTKYQLVLAHTYYAIPTLITSNSLKDFKELDSIDVNKSYWNKDIMDQLSYKGHYYLGYSDFNLATTYVVAFNKSLYYDHAAAFNGETMYDYVTNGEWTLDKMSDVAQLIFEDKGSVSQNTYGLTGELWVPFVGFIQSSGESIVVQNTNTQKYSLSWNGNSSVKSKFDNIVNKISNIDGLNETYFWMHPVFTAFENPEMVTLDSGRAFMQLMVTSDLIKLTDKNVKFGVLPYPMYDTEQYETTGYRSLNWSGYLCVPSNNILNAKMVGDVIECLSYYSKDVTTCYYEQLLGVKASDAPEDVEMLDIIWDSLCCDFGVTYEMIDSNNHMDALVYTVPQCIMFQNSFTVHTSSHSVAAKKALDDYVNNKK